VFEDGHLTDGLGNTIDFKNTIIIMTSNIGARFLSKHTSLGFQAPSEAVTEAKMEDAVMVEVKRLFNPEFINRLDEIIIFSSLTDDDLERIIEMMIEQLNENLVHKHLEVSLTEEARLWILEKVCKDRNYGARPLRRAIQRYIEDPLSEALIQGNLSEISKVEVYRDGDELWYRSKDAEEVGVPLTI
jgi:ATP-dependent Clp protease ATP-binding subunit ClpC